MNLLLLLSITISLSIRDIEGGNSENLVEIMKN